MNAKSGNPPAPNANEEPGISESLGETPPETSVAEPADLVATTSYDYSPHSIPYGPDVALEALQSLTLDDAANDSGWEPPATPQSLSTRQPHTFQESSLPALSSAPQQTNLAARMESTGPETVDERVEMKQAAFVLLVQNIRPERGRVKVAVFTSDANFPNSEAAIETFEIESTSTESSRALATREACAVAVFQDINGDGKLTKNRLGIPVEPCAFSNNAVIRRGPPRFLDAAIMPVENSTKVVQIELP